MEKARQLFIQISTIKEIGSHDVTNTKDVYGEILSKLSVL